MVRCLSVLSMALMVLTSSPSAADGLRYSRERLAAIGRRAARGERVFAIFDVDNTLVDTRYRTRAALASYLRTPLAAATDRRLLSPGGAARLAVTRVGYDGAATAALLGLRGAPRGDFAAHWERFFWAPRNLRFDRPMAQTVALAREADALGIEVVYLTGRYAERRAATARQLARCGLPNADVRHVIAKSRGQTTPSFKASVVRELEGLGQVALFLSDAVSDVAAIQRWTGAGSAAVLVDFPVGPSGPAPRLRPGTPQISYGRAAPR